MALTALVMAGGRATRMGETEKPLLQVGGKPMIQHVIEALRKSEFIDRIIVTVTRNTPRTTQKMIQLGIEVTETLGHGYESDMKQAIKTLGLGDVVVLSADLPFLTPDILNAAVKQYLEMKKPALMVAAPIELYSQTNIAPSYVLEMNGRKLAPIGVNIINGKRVDEPELEETVLVTEAKKLVFNVNTPTELKTARAWFGKDQ
jgi:adenosylcobinamide-phosphate guanylyltransferase